MGYDEIVLDRNCGCKEIVREHDFFNYSYSSYKYCDFHMKEKEDRYKKHNENKYKALYDFKTEIEEMEYEKVPIKYLRQLNTRGSNEQNSYTTLDYNLLKITKERNRYYCCKNRVDAFIKADVHNYYTIPKKYI